MKRIALTDGTGRWFNSESADLIKEETFWNGHDYISKATGSKWEHECLYRTKGGRWVLSRYTDYQGSAETCEEIDNEAAARWLASQGIDPHEACEAEYNALEIH